MSKSKKTFAGFGFGPIQSGLFLYEAYLSGNFDRFVVAEVDQVLVDAVADSGGAYRVNIARPDRIDPFRLDGIEIVNPTDPKGRETMVQAVAEATELATALPSVQIYGAGGEGSVASILAAGLKSRKMPTPTVLYAAENHNHAAEVLTRKLDDALRGEPEQFQALNTVIGKMSGVIDDPDVIDKLGLVTLTPDTPRAVLIEEFNRILISKVTLDDFDRGIEVFQEKTDLLPFEEAKLYGHNAVHAVIGYLADLKGYETIADAGGDENLMVIARRAFIDECGQALLARHRGLDDPLFTHGGFRDYAEDLLERMVNPNLHDLVERVGRDHVRKLGYDDRLFGTMRIALREKVMPVNLALGAAAGVLSMIRRRDELTRMPASLPESGDALGRSELQDLLMELWGDPVDVFEGQLIGLTWDALGRIRAGRAVD